MAQSIQLDNDDEEAIVAIMDLFGCDRDRAEELWIKFKTNTLEHIATRDDNDE